MFMLFEKLIGSFNEFDLYRLRKSMRRLFFISFILVFSLSAFPAEAAKVKAVNLEQLVEKADRIFVGTCTLVEEIKVPGTQLPATRYTFWVSESLKGKLDEVVVIRQFGVRDSGGEIRRSVGPRIPGMPIYEEGEEVILFLAGDSKVGMTSPIGFSQGAFRVINREGVQFVENGVKNLGLFRGLLSESQAAKWKLSDQEHDLMSKDTGPLDYDLFTGLVRKILHQP